MLYLSILKKIIKKNIYYMEADYDWGRSYKLQEWRAEQKIIL